MVRTVNTNDLELSRIFFVRRLNTDRSFGKMLIANLFSTSRLKSLLYVRLFRISRKTLHLFPNRSEKSPVKKKVFD